MLVWSSENAPRGDWTGLDGAEGLEFDNEWVGFNRGNRGAEFVLLCRTGEPSGGGKDCANEALLAVFGGEAGVGETEVSLTGRLAWRRSRVLKFFV